MRETKGVFMTDKDFLKELISRGAEADEGYFQYAHIVACLLDKRLHEQLTQLINGPVWDGDVVCKGYRGELFDLGLAIRVCYKGEQGFTGATYFAFSVMKCANDIKAGNIGA
jgi:hypothetical protein